MLRRDFSAKQPPSAPPGSRQIVIGLHGSPSTPTPQIQRTRRGHPRPHGIRTSRLAMGTGTVGFAGRSNQTRLGMSPFSRLLLNGTTRTASASSTPPILRQPSLRRHRHQATPPRRSPSSPRRQPRPRGVRTDLDRFRKNRHRYLDIVLIHCVTGATDHPLPRRHGRPLEASTGHIRASRRLLPTGHRSLRAAAASPWSSRPRPPHPIGSHMDATPTLYRRHQRCAPPARHHRHEDPRPGRHARRPRSHPLRPQLRRPRRLHHRRRITKGTKRPDPKNRRRLTASGCAPFSSITHEVSS